MNRTYLHARHFSGFVLRHPAWSVPKPVGRPVSAATLRAIPATLDTFLALHLNEGMAPEACAPTPPLRQAPHSQSMWAACGGRMVLFDAHRDHAKDLERHWDAYHLSDMVGDPAHPGVAWGRLDHLEDNRE